MFKLNFKKVLTFLFAFILCFGLNDLTWEKTKTFNIGVDASFFNNQLNLTFDYFYKRTTDILRGSVFSPLGQV